MLTLCTICRLAEADSVRRSHSNSAVLAGSVLVA
jgi:hypothetical protein